MNEVETINKQIEELQKKLNKLTKFPCYTTITLHSDKESMYVVGERLGLEGESLYNFAYTASEVSLDIIVDADGNAKAVGINGKIIETPVEI